MQNPVRAAFILMLSTALVISAQTTVEPAISPTSADTTSNPNTATPKPETKPRTRLWRPVGVGLGACAISGPLFVTGVVLYVVSGGGTKKLTQGVTISAAILAVGGLTYAVVGGIYNATLPKEKAGKKAEVQVYGITPEISFTQYGELRPEVMGWVSF